MPGPSPTPAQIAALGAAGATLGLVHGILTHPDLGRGARESIPPDVLAELLARVEQAGALIDAALDEYQAERMKSGEN